MTYPGAPFAGDQPWGIAEIAKAAGVKRQTVDQWRLHGKLPEPSGYSSGNPYWWRSVIMSATGAGGNVRTRLAHHLAGEVADRLRSAGGGWVPLADLLALAPEGRRTGHIEDIPGNDIMGYDRGEGPAWDEGGSGQPDGRLLEDAIIIARKRLAREGCDFDEGYPGGSGRSFRITASPA